jgi:cell wall assembly regulator SMI1
LFSSPLYTESLDFRNSCCAILNITKYAVKWKNENRKERKKLILEMKQTSSGSIETVQGFEPAFKADIVWGTDWLTFDPSGTHARVNLKALATTEEGHAISFAYTATIVLNDEIRKILTMQPDMKTVPFGSARELCGFLSFLPPSPSPLAIPTASAD